VGDEPFAVILADDLIDAKVAVMQQMAQVHAKNGGSVVAVQNVPRAETSSYGIVSSEPISKGLSKITAMVEKPKPEDAPSTLGVVGRYILSPHIFRFLETARPGAGREIQLTDAIARRVAHGEVVARRFTGTRFDCGSKHGFMAANLALGRKLGLCD